MMRITHFAFGFLLFLGISTSLSCGGANSDSNKLSSEVLYVLESGNVTTYSIDPASLNATPAEQAVTLTAPPSSVLQFDPSPKDHFIYDVWADGQNVQHLSVFQTDDFGVPQLPAVQTIDADSLSQFNMHPAGKFAYMLQVSIGATGEYYAKIRLFSVQTADGKLNENGQLQGTYGPAPFYPAFLYGFSPDASKLYINSQSMTNSTYLQRVINTANGTLGLTKQLIQLSPAEDVTIGSVLAVLHQSNGIAEQYLDIFPNAPSPKRTIHCTTAMLSYCGSTTNIQLDHSGKYLFFTDPATAAIHVARINLTKHRLVDTGNSMPMTSQTPGFAFNRDGTIVYAMQTDGNLHFFHFGASSGALTEGGTPLPLAQGSGICPARHQ